MVSSVQRLISIETHVVTNPKNISNLNSLINLDSIECLNEDPKHTADNVLIKDLNDPTRYLSSLDDEQLLIKIYFNQKVCLKEILIKCNELIIKEKSYPTKIKIFKNQTSMDFCDAESEKPIQEINLVEEDIEKERLIRVRQARFQNISSLVLFVEKNAGFMKTKIQYIGLYGSIPDSTNISEWKPKAKGPNYRTLGYY